MIVGFFVSGWVKRGLGCDVGIVEARGMMGGGLVGEVFACVIALRLPFSDEKVFGRGMGFHCGLGFSADRDGKAGYDGSGFWGS